MARIHGRVTRQHNVHNKVFGSGWQSRYRARFIQDSNDLRHVVAYVHLNPVTAGLTDDPAKYRQSGHRALIGQTNPVLINTHAALGCFDQRSWAQARQRYLEYVRCVAEVKWLHNTLRTLPWWQTVKDDHQTVSEEEAPPEAQTFNDKHPDLPFHVEESIEDLLVRAAPLLGVDVGEIVGMQKRSSVALARRRFTLIASRHLNHSLKAIGETVGKHSSQVSRWLNWETEAYYADPQEAHYVDEIAARLVKETPLSKG